MIINILKRQIRITKSTSVFGFSLLSSSKWLSLKVENTLVYINGSSSVVYGCEGFN